MTKTAIWKDGTSSGKTTKSDNFTVGFRFIVNGTSLEFFAKDLKMKVAILRQLYLLKNR